MNSAIVPEAMTHTIPERVNDHIPGGSVSSDLYDSEAREIPDEVLAVLLRDGDSDAFALFFARYSGVVRRVARRILRDDTEAEDTTQTVFWDAHRAMNRYDPVRGSLRTWLLQYAYHRALNHKEALQRRGFYNASSLDILESARGSRAALLPLEAAAAVQQAMLHLNEDQRRTLQMLFLDGLEMTDVAERLQQNVSNVRHHYYRGLKKLRELLGPVVLRG